jgi:hypothetical protein
VREEGETEGGEAHHPWELTLEEFVEAVKRYGYEGHLAKVFYLDGRASPLDFVKSAGIIKKVAHLAGIGPEERLSASTTASLCRRLGIPEEDFGLEAEEPYEPVEEE